jgi:hypothetical protein
MTNEEPDDEEDSSTKKEKCIALLKKYTRHKNVRLVQRGNAAIFCALYIVKKANPKPFILIPDQGGWISFKTYPKILGFEVRTVKTDRGLIDLIDLEKKAESGAALFVTSFAGYFAEQPLKYVSQICRKNKCLLIEDASGAVGDSELCNGEHSDIIVGSFGKWKPINAGYGGFISVANKEHLEDASDIFSTTNHYPEYDTLLSKLEKAEKRLADMLRESGKVKEELGRLFPDAKIIHKDLRGLNVMVKYMNEADKKGIISYCKDKGYEYVQCPKYIRLEEEAISIEIKRK